MDRGLPLGRLKVDITEEVAMCTSIMRLLASGTRLVRILKAPATMKNLKFDNEIYAGSSVSISGDGRSVAMGSPKDNTYSGRVEVYKWTGSGWEQLGLTIVGESRSFFGGAVSLSNDGNIIAVGGREHSTSTGHGRVYDLNLTISHEWQQVGEDIAGESYYN